MASAAPFLRDLVFAGLAAGPVLSRRLSFIESSGALPILNLHRISNDATAALTPTIFNELLRWLQTRFRIVTFNDLQDLRASGKPPLILSFDDGYKDFSDLAAPILAKHGARANQNIIPACADANRPPMNVLLQDFIRQAPVALLREIKFPGLARSVDPDRRIASGIRASAAFKSRPISEQKALFELLKDGFSRFDGFRPTAMMSVDDIKVVAVTHEIGAHSFEHASMSAETDSYLADDAAKCRTWFESKLGFLPSIYAFPNGAVRAGQAELVRDAGFKTVLLVGEGFSSAGGWQHPRFTFHAQTRAEALFRATGGFACPFLSYHGSWRETSNER